MKLKILLGFIIIGPLFLFFKLKSQDSKYTKYVGDIVFDSTLDNKDFFLCNENNIIQYHNNSKGLEYEEEKPAINEAFKKDYKPIPDTSQNGSIRIRFVVNCKGQTDRFRMIGMDESYQSMQFNAAITDQLLKITKQLDGWIPKSDGGKEVDYYQYLIFKINYGEIIEIMP